MGITTYSFVLVFVPFTVIGWWVLQHVKYKNYFFATSFLTVVSLWFIGSYDYRFVMMIFFTVLVNYFGVKLISFIGNKHLKSFLMICLVFENVSILLLLKYVDWLRSLFDTVGQPWNLILPIGIIVNVINKLIL